MAVQGITTEGKEFLFGYGWTSKVSWVRLYTDADVLVDEQTITLTWDDTNKLMKTTASVVFDVAANTNDVSYATYGWTLGLDVEVFTEIFSELYDFSTAGTLTLDHTYFYLSNTYLTDAGEEELATNGFETITWAGLYAASAVYISEQTVSFSEVDGELVLDSPIVFDVASGIIPRFVDLRTISTGPSLVYREFDTAIEEFTTPGTLTVDSWVFSI